MKTMTTMRYCFALDLIDDDMLIEEYKSVHQSVWPEISASIKSTGIEDLEIYLVQNRLFMIMETRDSFSLVEKEKMDSVNPVVQKWEEQMWKYQKALPNAETGEKWMLMERIFKLDLYNGRNKG